MSSDRSVAVAAISRVVLVDKPVGPTSFAVVRAARRGFNGRVGHTGTLDPFASGLLVVLLGRATRASGLLMGLPKEYEMVVQFGAVSSTADPTGEITQTGARVTAGRIAVALDAFRGSIVQRVPLTSAVKVGGEPLYKKAHRGETAPTPEREVMIHQLDMVDFDDQAQTARLIALTGSGAYLRTLAEDIGVATGAGAHAAALRRTRIGGFRVADALRLEDLVGPSAYEDAGPGVLDLDEALGFLPRLDLRPEQARLAWNGNLLQTPCEGRFRVHGAEGLLGVYEGAGGVARPLVVFSGGA